MRLKTAFTIVEDNKDVMIVPISVSKDDKLNFIVTNGVLLNPQVNFKTFKWKVAVRHFWKTFKVWFSNLPFRTFRNTKKMVAPIEFTDRYSTGRIYINGPLIPSMSGKKYTDSAFLIPSQEWLSKKVQEWLFKGMEEQDSHSFVDGTPAHEWERNSYLTWANSQVKSGRKVKFLAFFQDPVKRLSIIDNLISIIASYSVLNLENPPL